MAARTEVSERFWRRFAWWEKGWWHMDNEGEFTLTGLNLLDHLAWFAPRRVAELRAFAQSHGLPPPLGKRERSSALKGLLTPHALLDHRRAR